MMINDKKADTAFFVALEDIDTNTYVSCFCVNCNTVTYIISGTTPESMLYNINDAGWRVYDEYPGTPYGWAGLVCPDCLYSLINHPADNGKIHKHFLKGDLSAYIEKKNQKITEKYDDR